MNITMSGALFYPQCAKPSAGRWKDHGKWIANAQSSGIVTQNNARGCLVCKKMGFGWLYGSGLDLTHSSVWFGLLKAGRSGLAIIDSLFVPPTPLFSPFQLPPKKRKWVGTC